MDNNSFKLSEIKLHGFRSFIKKALDLNILVHKYENTDSLFRLTYHDKIIYTNDGFIPFTTQLGKFTLDKEVTKNYTL